jgi:hypothetical protein
VHRTHSYIEFQWEASFNNQLPITEFTVKSPYLTCRTHSLFNQMILSKILVLISDHHLWKFFIKNRLKPSYLSCRTHSVSSIDFECEQISEFTHLTRSKTSVQKFSVYLNRLMPLKLLCRTHPLKNLPHIEIVIAYSDEFHKHHSLSRYAVF